MKRYDLIVIGSGPGGAVAAKTAARLGVSVAIVELKESQLGGNDLHAGSIPSKALLNSTYFTKVSWRNSKKYLGDTTAKLYARHTDGGSYLAGSIDKYFGEAKFVGSKTIKVDKQELTARKIIIATGARPFVPNIRGLKKAGYDTYETFYHKSALPKKITILGGGQLGVEMAFSLQRLGARVSIVEHNSQLMHQFDSDVSEIITDNLAAEGVKVYTSSTVLDIDGSGGKYGVNIRQAGQNIRIQTESIFVATGKTPNIPAGLKKSGIIMTPQGICVNNNWRTNKKHLYAIGDIAATTGKYTHSAERAAYDTVRHAFLGTPNKHNPAHEPYVIFTDPEVAQVGMTSHYLLKNRKDHRSYSLKLNETDRGIIDGSPGLIRINTSAGGVIIGATVVAKNASDIIGYLALAVSKGWHLGKLLDLPLPYPTVAYGIRQMALEAELQNTDSWRRFAYFRKLLKR